MVPPDLATWRALVEKELAGASFDKLVTKTAEGLALDPLYVEHTHAPPPPGVAPFVRGARADAPPFSICMRVEPPETRRPGALNDDLDGGAEALWCTPTDDEAIAAANARGLPVLLDAVCTPSPDDTTEVWAAFDVPAEVASGRLPPGALDAPWPIAALMGGAPNARGLRISGLPFHDAGADAADELALMMSSLVAHLRALETAGLDLALAPRRAWAQLAVGRDTFGEICKLRALRVLWHKVFAAAGVPDAALDSIHAVCSARTTTARDPWVNMLRVTTQVFAAALGGARFVTPRAFDAELAASSALGQRVARNTALVLREESQLGRVLDAAGGSYYIEARTDALAREAWTRFGAIERDGGLVALLRSGELRRRLAASWATRTAALARRKEPVLGVSEFANLGETLPAPPRAAAESAPPPALVAHRDGEAFEALRTKLDATRRSVALLLLGPPAEHRARVGFAEGVFAAGGLAARSIAAPEAVDVVCLCGSDERYASEAAATVRALKAAGARRVALAGRPGALETELRAAGVDAFIFVGCDLVTTLQELFA